jgi:hypothetical protein
MRYEKIAALLAAALLGLAAKHFWDQSKAAEASLAASKKWGEELERDVKKNQDAARILQAEMAPKEKLPDVKITYRRESGAERPKPQERQAK